MGFELGVHIAPKKAETAHTWKITHVDEDEVKCVLMEHGLAGTEKSLTWTAMFEGWRVHKGKVTSELRGWNASNRCSPMQSTLWKLDIAKGAIGFALWQEYETHQHLAEHIRLLQHPTSVRVTKNYKVGELILVPATQRIERKQGEKGLPICTFKADDTENIALFIHPQFVAPFNAQGEKNQSPWVVPFWAAATTTESDFNMELTFQKKDVFGYVIYVPILRNKQNLKDGDELVWNKKEVCLPWLDKSQRAAKRQKKA